MVNYQLIHKTPIAKPSVRGFTLMELIIVLVIIGIMAGIAFPAFRSFTNSSQVTSAANDLVSALNLARSEAVTRGTPVTVCKSANQTTCTTNGNWDQGWIIFTDANSNGVVDTGDGDAILRVYASPSGNATMTGGSASVANFINYAPTGFASVAGDVAERTITVNFDGKTVLVRIGANGRVSTE